MSPIRIDNETKTKSFDIISKMLMYHVAETSTVISMLA